MSGAPGQPVVVNGLNITDFLTEYKGRQTAVPSSDGSGNPFVARERALSNARGDLEDVVKNHLNNQLKANHFTAESTVTALLEEYSKTIAGYKKNPKETAQEKRQRHSNYLTQIANETRNPLFAQRERLVEAILNMDVALPGDPLYNQQGPLGQLITYIASKGNEDTERLTYLGNEIEGQWKNEQVKAEASRILGLRVGPNAEAQEVLARYSQIAQQRANLLTAQYQPQTYLKGDESLEPAPSNVVDFKKRQEPEHRPQPASSYQQLAA